MEISVYPLRRVVLPLATVALAAGVLSACGSDKKDDAALASSKNGTTKLDVQITDNGCTPDKLEVEAGPTTFNVTNTGTGKNTEYYVMNGSKIEGEVENVVPGIKRSLSLNLKEGTYTLECPQGSNQPKGTLTVKPSSNAAATGSQEAQLAVTNYRDYVSSQIDQLVTGTKSFTDAVKAGDVAKAKELYPTARIPYERIEPVAESFGDLDPAIDARADDTPIENITGFHRIEYQLWAKNNTEGMAPVADKLVADIQKLKDQAATLDFDAPKIANGANELLGEVSKSKVTGEEERYSHTDLWDFAANVEGASAAVAAVRPILDQSDAELGKKLDTQFANVNAALAPYKQGNGWVFYDKLTQDQTKALSQAVDALAEPLSQVGAKVVSATS